MDFSKDEIEELKHIAPFLRIAEEGANTYILIEQLQLPPNCKPSTMDVLLCPHPRDNYNSRLFFSSKPTGIPERNWNGVARVLDRSWYAISWRTSSKLRLAAMLMVHLNALRHEDNKT